MVTITEQSLSTFLSLTPPILTYLRSALIIIIIIIIIIMMMMMMMTVMMMMIALKGAIRDLLQSPHCAANCQPQTLQ